MDQESESHPAERRTEASSTAESGPVGRGAPLLYCVTIFTSAFLLFQIQPLLGKYVLPWFGGTPAVWTTCLLFFQVALLAGYTYAHLLATKLPPRYQSALHGMLLALALLAVWFVFPPTSDWKPLSDESPTGRILLLLCVSIGLPYLLLASTGPLVQSWFSQTDRDASPYRLYALSNLGSLLALVSYPFVFEPTFALHTQALVWAAGYVVFVAGSALCAVRLFRSHAPAAAEENESSRTANVVEPPRAGQVVLWLLLSSAGSLMLLATTNQLCQDVAVVPFLWVLPLSLYLVTFIVAFDRPHWYVRKFFAPILVIASALGILVLYQGAASFVLLIAGYSSWMFVCCMVFHGELVHLKPHPRYLTHFYLSIAVGGAVGGVFVSLVAPRIFSGYWEFHLGGFSAAALLLVVTVRDQMQKRIPKTERRWLVLTGALSLGMLAAALLWHIFAIKHKSELMVRNFYGVLRLFEREGFLTLTHGQTIHGLQRNDPEGVDLPTSYYTKESGVGTAVRYHPHRQRGLHVGVVGLGAGTMAAYARQHDQFEFYEINPAVIELADNRFTYLARARKRGADISLHLGDARITLERQLAAGEPRKFDVLVVDAFSSDAIPVHLLTAECFKLYWEHMAPGGIVAVHISNRYLDLRPVVETLANRSGHTALQILYAAPEEKPWLKSSRWVLVTSNAEFMQQPAVRAAARHDLEGLPEILWTDDFSNLFQVLAD